MLLVLEFGHHTHSFLFSNVLLDPQRTGMCVKHRRAVSTSKAVHAANKNKQHLFILIRWDEFNKQGLHFDTWSSEYQEMLNFTVHSFFPLFNWYLCFEKKFFCLSCPVTFWMGTVYIRVSLNTGIADQWELGSFPSG